jgi:hypothetical protein
LTDNQQYTIVENELMEQVNGFREENNLLLGSDFKIWLMKKYLFQSNLEMIFMDYAKLKKYYLVSYNYHNYFQG